MENINNKFKKYNTIYTTSFGIYKNQIIRNVLLNNKKFKYIKSKNLHKIKIKKNICFIGWGKKDNTLVGYEYCNNNNIPYIRMEDGFIRSNGLGVSGAPSMSFTIDESGIFYDDVNGSDLKKIIYSQILDKTEDIEYIHDTIKYITDNKISKYNNIKTSNINSLSLSDKKNIIIIGQVDNDMSLKYGLVDNNNVYFDIIEYIMKNNNNFNIYLKLHPDILSGIKKSSLDLNKLLSLKVNLITENYNPIELLEKFDEIHVLTSQMGFEALLINKVVHTWGVPFYSGYGLTTDHNTYYLTNNKPKKTIEEIFKSMYFDYTLYVDLDNKSITNIERIFARIKNFTVEKKIFSKIINFFVK